MCGVFILFVRIKKDVPTHVIHFHPIFNVLVFFYYSGYGDVSVGNRAFGSFFVLLGAGVVGTIFGLVSFRIMEEQETLMNLRLTQLASKLSKMREIRKLKRCPSSSTSCRYSTEESQSSMDSSRIPSTPDSGMSQRWKSFSGAANITIRKALRISPKNEQCDGILDLNMAVYEDEISDLKVTAVGNVLLFFITLFTGAVCMSAIEGWDFTDAVYWVRNILNHLILLFSIFLACLEHLFV
jgi:hypothetical protein